MKMMVGAGEEGYQKGEVRGWWWWWWCWRGHVNSGRDDEGSWNPGFQSVAERLLICCDTSDLLTSAAPLFISLHEDEDDPVMLSEVKHHFITVSLLNWQNFWLCDEKLDPAVRTKLMSQHNGTNIQMGLTMIHYIKFLFCIWLSNNYLIFNDKLQFLNRHQVCMDQSVLMLYVLKVQFLTFGTKLNQNSLKTWNLEANF